VGGETVFVCVEGPEFDAHKVDFKELMQRGNVYQDQEKQSLDQFLERCRLEAAAEKVKEQG
jgi:ferredoxin--NADP+ reductase